MFLGFFLELRRCGVPVSLREYLVLLEALQRGVCGYRVEHFYYLARTTLVKDERHMDRFDQVFGTWFKGLEAIADPFRELPAEWLAGLGERYLSDEEKAQVEALGGWKELMETLQKRLAEQEERHQGGSKWIGTGGTSPFGAYGFNPAGVRIGQAGSRHRRAVKVWDKREFRDFDDRRELGTRDMKVALRRLRKLTREGRAEELDLEGTIRATARNGGWLDVTMRPERENRVKVLLLLDVGGSMDDHVLGVEQLFSAARSEFKHLEVYYFHNCLYERVWRQNPRWTAPVVPTRELLRTYGRDWRVIFVGDASMSPWEITQPGASVEHWNEEAGVAWMRRATSAWERCLWINPVPRPDWNWTPSIGILRELLGGRMVPLTAAGLDEGVRLLRA